MPDIIRYAIICVYHDSFHIASSIDYRLHIYVARRKVLPFGRAGLQYRLPHGTPRPVKYPNVN